MYTCGPTVYRFVHIGNLRTYLMADWIRRALEGCGLHVRQVKNITDVGHMRQDRVDRGEDKMVAAALAENKTPAEIAAFYTTTFQEDERRLGIQPAAIFPHATEHVPHMIALIQRLRERGHAYASGGNVYFDVASFASYGRLSGNLDAEALREAERTEADPLKRDPRDFALWKAAEPGRTMKWASPWGDGFPGWHIECSAMAFAHLGEQLDLHTGGVDNIFPHHEDEIAQSEAATGKPFARHWIHAQHLLADGLKMAKSTGNVYTLSDLQARGFDPLDFRYLCLTVHYRTRLNFTFMSLRAARRGLDHLRERIWRLYSEVGETFRETEVQAAASAWRERFQAHVRDDLRLPAALATLWGMLRSGELTPAEKLAMVREFDDVLGLDLLATARAWGQPNAYPADVRVLLDRRSAERVHGDYAAADEHRLHLHALGYAVRDALHDTLARPELTPDRLAGTLSFASQLPSLLHEPDACEFSLCVYNTHWPEDTRRCVESILRYAGDTALEVLVVDAGLTDGASAWLADVARRDARVRMIRADHELGEAEARNAALRQCRGRYCVVLDTSIEATGDIFTPLRRVLEQPRVVVAGPYGLVTSDLRHFEEDAGPDVDAIEGYLMAFPRAAIRRVGWMDLRYRFYRNLDLDYSFTLRQKGVKDAATDPDRAVVVANLPVIRHAHRIWETLSDEERAKRSKKNFDVFLKKWHHHTHLLVRSARMESR